MDYTPTITEASPRCPSLGNSPEVGHWRLQDKLGAFTHVSILSGCQLRDGRWLVLCTCCHTRHTHDCIRLSETFNPADMLHAPVVLWFDRRRRTTATEEKKMTTLAANWSD